jgi:magnesium-transporting ATPase (P-type)
MVLTDDNFASIVAAVEEGRVIYDNIRKFVRFLLSSNIGEILVMFVALLAGMPIPLLAIQILWVNLVTDGLPAIALGFEPGEPGVMKRKPRDPNESIFAQGMGVRIIYMAVVLSLLTLGAYLWAFYAYDLNPFNPTLRLERLSEVELAALVEEEHIPAGWDEMTAAERIEELGGAEGAGAFSVEEEEGGSALIAEAERFARTVAFTVLSFGQIFHVLAIHAGNDRSFFAVWFKENQFMLWAVLSTFALQLLVIYVPFLQDIFETVPLSASHLAVAVVISAMMLFVTELEKLIRKLDQGTFIPASEE